MARFGLRDRLRPASGKRSASRPSRNSWGRRLVLESLEQRVVLSTVIWDGGGGDSNWNNPRNWDNDLLPGPDDDVYIDISAVGPSTVTLSSGTVAIKSLQSGKSLAISGGTFSVSTTADINNDLTLSNGALTGSGIVTVSGMTTWTGGMMSGSGVTNALGGMAIGSSGGHDVYLRERRLNNAGGATLAARSLSYGL